MVTANPCVCGCGLRDAAFWIAGLELIWNVIGLGVFIGKLVSVNSDHATTGSTGVLTPAQFSDQQKNVDNDNNIRIGVIVSLAFYGVGIGLALLLFLAAAKRLRGLCYVWVFGLVALMIGHIVLLPIYPTISESYMSVVALFFRIYYILVVIFFALEIAEYPNGPPVVREVYVDPGYVDQPVMYAARPPIAYAYPPGYGYGYGYGPGYYAGDAAIAGMAIGAGIGMGLGGGYYCDDFCCY